MPAASWSRSHSPMSGWVSASSQAQSGPVEAAVVVQDLPAETFGDGLHRRLTRRQHGPGSEIAVDDVHAQGLKTVGDGGLATADAAGETDHESRHVRVQPRNRPRTVSR